MKYELLKRTAIALFVGSVISTYSVAEGSKISTKSSLEDIASAINKNDENISKIKTDVSDLAKSLKGDDQNPGLLDALEEANKGVNENKAALDKKADKEDVNKIKQNVSDLAKSLKGDDQNPGLLDALEEANKGVNENKAALDKKADKEDVNKIKQNVSDLAKSLKGDDQNPGLLDSLEEANKGINENKEALALKADKATVDVELAKKANQADVETNKAEIAKFGAQTNSNAALLLTMAGKVDQNKKDTDEAIAKNASRITDTRNKQVLQNARLDNHGERIEANEAAIGELAKATDESVTNLGNAVNELDENLAGTQDAVAENRKDIDKNASRITDTRNKQVLQNARLDNHGERIEANEAAIGELAKATDESVTNLGNAVNELDENLAGTQDAVAENRKDIDANAVAIDKLKETQTYKDLSKVETLVKDKASKAEVEKNASRITDTRNKQVLQNARLDNHGERIEANEAAIGELAKATDKAVTNLGDTVRDLDADLAGTQDAVAENRKDIDKNASRITDTRNKQVLQNARLDNHGERIEANEAAIGELAKATDKAVTNLGDTVRDLDADLAGTQDAVAENRKDIDKNASRITDTRNKQVLQNARLDNHSERITAAEVALDTKADKTELAAKADKTELANKADKNSVYSKSETDNKFALKADNSVVRAQATDINKLRTDVNAHTKRLDHLDNRVNKLDKDLKRGLAAQAALTGLFQPYTVGKANFTAAVGGYKSQTAVAIGTGYRYTQNIATKAGVAFTQGGGVTYNAGVNFEW